MVSITLRVLSRPDIEHLPRIYKSLGLDYDERVLPSIGNEVLKSIVAQFDAAELITQREVVRLPLCVSARRPVHDCADRCHPASVKTFSNVQESSTSCWKMCLSPISRSARLVPSRISSCLYVADRGITYRNSLRYALRFEVGRPQVDVNCAPRAGCGGEADRPARYVSDEYRVCPIDGSVHLDAERAKFIVEKVRLRVLPECEP